MVVMSEQRYQRKQLKPNHLSAKDWLKYTTAAGAIAVAGIATVKAKAEARPLKPAANEPYLEYTAKAGDTEWSIGTEAYRQLDPREAAELIDEQNPNENHLVLPGQKFRFGLDAELGTKVDPSASED